MNFFQFLNNNAYQICILRLCRFICAAKKGLPTPTSLYPSAAEGLRGGAGRRQLRDQGLLIFGGSRGPRLTALRLPRWDRWVGVPTMLSGLPSTVYVVSKDRRQESVKIIRAIKDEFDVCHLWFFTLQHVAGFTFDIVLTS